MSDEFDDLSDAAPPMGPLSALVDNPPPSPVQPARLISRLYAAASTPLRAQMLADLLRPLSPLAIVGIAAGAFASFLHRTGPPGGQVALSDVGNYSNEQIFELARFVEQVSPEALQQVATLVADSPISMTALSVSAALLLTRLLRGKVAQVHRSHRRLATLPSDQA